MSDETARFTVADQIMAFLTAWLIGFGTSVGVATVAAGTLNRNGLFAAAIGGLVTAAKDWRSLKRLPSITNGNGNTESFTK